MLPLLKQHVDAEGYAGFARDIAAAVDAIDVALLAKVLSAHPDMEAEIDANLRKYDRFLCRSCASGGNDRSSEGDRQMEGDLARHVIRTAFRTARELSGLLAMLKQYLDEEEYKAYARRIATRSMRSTLNSSIRSTRLSPGSRTRWRQAWINTSDSFSRTRLNSIDFVISDVSES